MRKLTLLYVTATVALAAALAAAPNVLADTGDSSNWAGYSVHRPGLSFSSVSASWIEPGARCHKRRRRYSAVWVGLGGFASTSQALEQVGTEIDCTRGGRVATSAWYELVPQASRSVHLQVHPGDQMAAAVSVAGHQVSLTLSNLTTHAVFQRTVTAPLVDVGSADWIVEAPSECVSSNSCQTLPLANFGSATFSSAQAQTTTGHLGPISDPAWSNTKIRLRPGGRRFVIYHGSGAAAGAAIPSPLGANGSSFSVKFALVRVYGKLLPAGDGRRRASYLVH